MPGIKEDISSIVDIIRNPDIPAGVLFGCVEDVHGNMIKIKPGNNSKVERSLEEMFSDVPETSRIAIVRLNEGNCFSKGAWASAANTFCDKNIVGAFVMETMSYIKSFISVASPYHTKAMHFEDCLPESFIDAGMPILFDETGLLTALLTKSTFLEVPSCLSFPDIEEEISSMRLANGGCVVKEGRCPVFDALGSDIEKEVADVVAGQMQFGIDLGAGFALVGMGVKASALEGLRGKADFIEKVTGEIVSFPAIRPYSGTVLSNEPAYAVMLGKGNAAVDEIEEQCLLLMSCVHILKREVSKVYDLDSFTISQDLDIAANQLRQVLEESGAIHQIRALAEGVPYEDVVA